MDAIAGVDPDVAASVFATGRAIALGGRAGAISGRSWASVATFEADLASGAITPDLRVVMYDPERWRHTPLDEQRDPIGSIERFGRVAGAGWLVRMITPHPSLVSVDAAAGTLTDGSEEATYEFSGITEAAALSSEIVEIQAQRLQAAPHGYRDLVAATAARARAVNPDVLVLSGLATSPGFPATSRMLVEAWDSVLDVVDGHYVSLSRGRYPDVMADFLRMVT
jgi:hypothetical protein